MAENEIIYQPESSLPAVPASQVAHLRALNTAGESVNITPSTLRELTGIDYSKLEEQIVPGEFWVDANGDKRQVYCRRFRIEIPSLASRVSYGQIPMQGFSTILQTSGTWLINTTSFVIGHVNCDIYGTIRDLFRINTDGGAVWYQLIGTVGASVKIDLLVSYTK